MNRCRHTQTTARTVPIERLSADGTTTHRVPGAQWYTCAQCGVSFYREATLVQEGVPVQALQAAVPQEDVC